MKIGIVKKKIPIPSANVINTLNHADGFSKLGHDVEVLAIEELYEKIYRMKIGNIHKFYNIDKKVNIKFIKGNLLFFLRDLKIVRGIINLLTRYPKLFYLFDPEIITSKHCIKNHFDLVYCRNCFRVAYNNIINKIPTIIESHHFNHPNELKKIIFLTKSKSFKGIVTISQILKNQFIKTGFPEEKVYVMEDAVNLEQFDKITNDKEFLRKKLNLPINKKVLLYSGKLEKDRDIATILNAFKVFDKEKFALYFLGGNNQIIGDWKEYLIQNRFDADIKFLGFKSNRIVPYYLKAADVLIATFSNKVITLNWMSPIKIFEYMASKTPFIATKIGRINEICNNNECLLVNPEDSIDLTNKIKLLINSTELQRSLAENAYKKAVKHTYTKRCENIIKFLNKK